MHQSVSFYHVLNAFSEGYQVNIFLHDTEYGFKRNRKSSAKHWNIILSPPAPLPPSRSVGDHEGYDWGHSSDSEGIPPPGGPQHCGGPQAGLPRDHYAGRCSQWHLPHDTGRRLWQVQQDDAEKRRGHHVGLRWGGQGHTGEGMRDCVQVHVYTKAGDCASMTLTNHILYIQKHIYMKSFSTTWQTFCAPSPIS